MRACVCVRACVRVCVMIRPVITRSTQDPDTGEYVASGVVDGVCVCACVRACVCVRACACA